MGETGQAEQPATAEPEVVADAPDADFERLMAQRRAENIWLEDESLNHLLHVADIFAHSGIVPDRYRCKCRKRGEDCTCGAVADCAIVIAMAWKHRADILGFMQKVYVVHGTPGMEAQLAIALANTSGVWKAPIAHVWSEITDENGRKYRQCTAWAIDRKSGERFERSCSMLDANKMGWTAPVKLKGGGTMPSKWVTMEEDMMIYRSSMKLMRSYHPEVLLGMNTIDELHEIGPQGPEDNALSEQAQEITDKVEAAKQPATPLPSTPGKKSLREIVGEGTQVAEDEPAATPPAGGNGKQDSLLDKPKTAPEPMPANPTMAQLLDVDMSSLSDAQIREHRQAVCVKYSELCSTREDVTELPITTTRTTTLMDAIRKMTGGAK